jgi:hypothetical protein
MICMELSNYFTDYYKNNTPKQNSTKNEKETLSKH